MQNLSPKEPAGKRVKFTYQGDRSTQAGTTLEWLLKKGKCAAKELANEASEAFYLALAYADDPEIEPSIVKEAAEKAIWQLVGRIHLLHQHTDMDLTCVACALSPYPQIGQLIPKTPLPFPENSSGDSPPESSEDRNTLALAEFSKGLDQFDAL